MTYMEISFLNSSRLSNVAHIQGVLHICVARNYDARLCFRSRPNDIEFSPFVRP